MTPHVACGRASEWPCVSKRAGGHGQFLRASRCHAAVVGPRPETTDYVATPLALKAEPMAAKVDDVGRFEPRRDFVAQDEIWKRHVHAEVEAAKRWPKTWGFLTASPQELLKDEILRVESKSRDEIPGDGHATPAIPSKSSEQQQQREVVEAAPVCLPRTSQGVIGWQLDGPGPPLDHYGPRARGKRDLCKMLKWPREGFD
ncbi:ciliary microtubule inner protein 1 [Lampetra fluviatilis]